MPLNRLGDCICENVIGNIPARKKTSLGGAVIGDGLRFRRFPCVLVWRFECSTSDQAHR